jgi:hypothetical protein
LVNLAKGRGKCMTPASTVMNFQMLKNLGKFLTRGRACSMESSMFSEKLYIHR